MLSSQKNIISFPLPNPSSLHLGRVGGDIQHKNAQFALISRRQKRKSAKKKNELKVTGLTE